MVFSLLFDETECFNVLPTTEKRKNYKKEKSSFFQVIKHGIHKFTDNYACIVRSKIILTGSIPGLCLPTIIQSPGEICLGQIILSWNLEHDLTLIWHYTITG